MSEESVQDVAMVPVPLPRLQKFESEHEFLEQIRALGKEVDDAERVYLAAKDESLRAKKELDTKYAGLQSLISNGPKKPDLQGRLPFMDEEVGADSSSQASGETVAAKIDVPPDIGSLDATDRQKQEITRAGCKNLADVVSLASGAWPQYPGGLADLGGFGPKARARIIQQLPKTAPEVPVKESEPAAETVQIEILSFISETIQPGGQFAATRLPNNCAIVQLPGEEPTQLKPDEYRVVTASA